MASAFMVLQQHIHNNKQDSDLQAGLTKKRRIKNNLFILTYCIEKSSNTKKPLILIAVDFEKGI